MSTSENIRDDRGGRGEGTARPDRTIYITDAPAPAVPPAPEPAPSKKIKK